MITKVQLVIDNDDNITAPSLGEDCPQAQVDGIYVPCQVPLFILQCEVHPYNVTFQKFQ